MFFPMFCLFSQEFLGGPAPLHRPRRRLRRHHLRGERGLVEGGADEVHGAARGAGRGEEIAQGRGELREGGVL